MKIFSFIIFFNILLLNPISSLFSQQADIKTVEEEAFKILEKGARSADMEARAMSLKGLTMLKKKDTLPYILDALKDPQWIVHRSAIISLIKIGNKKYVEELNSILRNPSIPLETDIFEILNALSEKEKLNFLISAIFEKATQTREPLLRAVVKKGGIFFLEVVKKCYAEGRRDVLDELEKILLMVSENDRAPLCNLLINLKNLDGIKKGLEFIEKFNIKVPPKNLKNLLNHKEKTISIKSAEILCSLGDSSALKNLKFLLDSKEEEDNIKFLTIAKNCATKALIPEIRKFLHPETSPQILKLVYAIYAKVGDETILPKVEEELKSTILARRIAATSVIGELIGNRALPSLHTLLGDGNKEVRIEAAKAIGKLAQVESIKFLQRALNEEPDEEVRHEVVLALGKIHDKSIVDVLRPFAYDFNENVRKASIIGLANIHHESVLPFLRLFINDRDQKVRTAVVNAIIELSREEGLTVFESVKGWFPSKQMPVITKKFGSSFLPFIQKGIISERKALRKSSLISLKELPQDEEKILIDELSKNPYPDVRKYCLKRLSEIKKKDILPFVETALKDNASEVKILALDILSEYGDSSYIKKLGEILLDLDERVRIKSAITMLKIVQKKSRKR